MDKTQFLDICNRLVQGTMNDNDIDNLITEYCKQKGKTKDEDISKVKQAFSMVAMTGQADVHIGTMIEHFKREYSVATISDVNGKIIKFYCNEE